MNLSELNDYNFIPKIVYSDKSFILANYYNGKFPDFHSDIFANKIGTILAHMHNIKNKKGRVENINLHILKKIEKDIPSTFPIYLTYGDHNTSNYVECEDEQLKLIDLGSYVYTRYIDNNLINSEMYKLLNKEIFYKSYSKIVKDNFIKTQENEIKFIDVLYSLINNHDRYIRSPFYDFRLKEHKITNLYNNINDLNNLL